MTLSEYSDKHLRLPRRGEMPQYVFDAQITLATDMTIDIPPHPWFNKTLILQQFMLGPAFSGAPPHIHGMVLSYSVRNTC